MKDGMDKKISGIVHIVSENALPEGKLLSYLGDPLEIPEKNRKEMMVWCISEGEDKIIWLLALKQSYGNVNFMQLEKNAINLGYRIAKKGTIEANILNAVYDRRAFNDNQKASGDDSIVVGLFEVIVAEALAENVSDIHIEVRNTGGTVKMRKNGEMMVYNPDQRLTFNEAFNLSSVIYNVLASTKAVSFDPRDCQQAAVNYSVSNQELKLRYQSVPAYPEGFDIILRLLPVGRSEDFTPLQKLGYTEQQVSELLNISSRPVGSLIIAGVTGSGKSTTLKNLLMYINTYNSYKLKIYSIEDPPEYNIPRITQIPVVIGKDFDPTMSPFEKPIKACMRGDPDIIMIGEVRDKITGDLTKKAVQSGHQVLTTVHATSALGIIDRFQDFGLTRAVLGSPDFLTGLLYQKLLPLLCHKCAIDFNEHMNAEDVSTEDLLLYKRVMKIIDPRKFKINLRNASGCEACKFTGIRGRTVCAEVLMVDLDMAQLIAEGKSIELMKYWRSLSDFEPASENMRGKTCMEHGFQKMLAGLVCPRDVESSFRPIDEMLMKSLKKEVDSINNAIKGGEKDKDGWAPI